MKHQLRSNLVVKFFWGQETECYRGLFQRRSFLVSFLRTFGNIYNIKISANQFRLSTNDTNCRNRDDR
jgi:hypothetical protein